LDRQGGESSTTRSVEWRGAVAVWENPGELKENDSRVEYPKLRRRVSGVGEKSQTSGIKGGKPPGTNVLDKATPRRLETPGADEMRCAPAGQEGNSAKGESGGRTPKKKRVGVESLE